LFHLEGREMSSFPCSFLAAERGEIFPPSQPILGEEGNEGSGREGGRGELRNLKPRRKHYLSGKRRGSEEERKGG
jgi:hypothetical protein